jgi:hypothetical protein
MSSAKPKSVILSNGERLYRLVDAIEIVTRDRVDIRKALRWCNAGANGTKLERVKVGRELKTSVEAVTRFLARQSGAELVASDVIAASAKRATKLGLQVHYGSVS